MSVVRDVFSVGGGKGAAPFAGFQAFCAFRPIPKDRNHLLAWRDVGVVPRARVKGLSRANRVICGREASGIDVPVGFLKVGVSRMSLTERDLPPGGRL